jgi:hypothetical protein
MKKMMLTAIAAIGMLSMQAQDFKATLKKTVDAFDTTMSYDGKVQLYNKIQLIAKKWDNEWAAHYCQTYCDVRLSYDEKNSDKKDSYLDDADKELEATVSLLKKDNDETYVMRAYIANARLSVDPQNRWMKYGKDFSANLDEAKDLNPDNPRIYFLQGVSKFYTPKAFGGGKKAAKPYLDKAAPLFEKNDRTDIFKPYWGQWYNNYLLGQCKQEDKD